MFRTATPTRDRILQAARHLFWLDGFAATSVNDIVRRANTRVGSFYYQFKSKSYVLLHVLDRHIRAIDPSIIGPACRDVRDPLDCILAVLNHYRGYLLQSKFACGSLLGKLALDIPDTEPYLLEKISAGFDIWAACLAKNIQARLTPVTPSLSPTSSCSSSNPTNAELRSLSLFILAVMEGAIMQSRALRSTDPFDACIAHLRAYLATVHPQLVAKPAATETAKSSVL